MYKLMIIEDDRGIAEAMRKVLMVIISLMMVFTVSVCSSNLETEEVVEGIDNFAEKISRSQITSKSK